MRNKVMFCFIPRKLCLHNETHFQFVGWVWWQKAYLVKNLNHGWIAFVDDQNEEKLNPKTVESVENEHTNTQIHKYTNTQMLEDAKAAGAFIFKEGAQIVVADNGSSGCATQFVIKFAELTKARVIAELDALKTPKTIRVDGECLLPEHQHYWAGWHARGKLPTQSKQTIPKGYALVLIEPTHEILDAVLKIIRLKYINDRIASREIYKAIIEEALKTQEAKNENN